MNHGHELRHLHLGCGESLHSRLAIPLPKLRRRSRPLLKRGIRTR